MLGGVEISIRTKLADIGPYQRLNLALAHPGVNRPQDEIREPSASLFRDREQANQFLDREEPLPGHSTPDRIGIPARRLLDQTGSNRIVHDRLEGVELTLDGAGCCTR
jgi:hypothetical protein